MLRYLITLIRWTTIKSTCINQEVIVWSDLLKCLAIHDNDLLIVFVILAYNP